MTKGPTASRATSFTTDSKAIASIMPRCCSAACTWRTPNRMVNTAISAATMNEVSVKGELERPSPPRPGPAIAVKLDDTAWSWSAM